MDKRVLWAVVGLVGGIFLGYNIPEPQDPEIAEALNQGCAVQIERDRRGVDYHSIRCGF